MCLQRSSFWVPNRWLQLVAWCCGGDDRSALRDTRCPPPRGTATGDGWLAGCIGDPPVRQATMGSSPTGDADQSAPPAFGSVVVAVLGAAIAASIVFTGWHGGDLPAQVYRQRLFRSFGLLAWDGWWYAGHYWLTYSVISPVVSGVIGLPLTALGAAAVAAWAFDRLLTTHLPVDDRRTARVASVLFAGTLAVPLFIRQVTFLLGEAIGLLTVLAFQRRRPPWPRCWPASPPSRVPSPASSSCWCSWPGRSVIRPHDGRPSSQSPRRAPPALSTLLFGMAGPPFPVRQFFAVLATCAVALALLPAKERTMRWASALDAAGAVATFPVPNALGGNVTRLAAGSQHRWRSRSYGLGVDSDRPPGWAPASSSCGCGSLHLARWPGLTVTRRATPRTSRR